MLESCVSTTVVDYHAMFENGVITRHRGDCSAIIKKLLSCVSRPRPGVMQPPNPASKIRASSFSATTKPWTRSPSSPSFEGVLLQPLPSMSGNQWYPQTPSDYPRNAPRNFPPPNHPSMAAPAVDAVRDARRLLATYPLASATPSTHGTWIL